MIRKTLLLTIDNQPQQQKEANQSSFLAEKFPSYLHLAAIMNERTQEEKESFGDVKLKDLKSGKHSSSNSFFTEEKVDNLIDVYIT